MDFHSRNCSAIMSAPLSDKLTHDIDQDDDDEATAEVENAHVIDPRNDAAATYLKDAIDCSRAYYYLLFPITDRVLFGICISLCYTALCLQCIGLRHSP